MKGRVLALLALLTITATARADEDGALALQVTRELSETIGPRPTGSPAAALARKYLLARLVAQGLDPEEHTFASIVTPRIGIFGWTIGAREEAVYVAGSGQNVYAVIPGQLPEALVFTAHVDSDGPDVPGARDDAASAGVLVEVAVRALARARREGPPRRARVFAFVDGEERGLLGSRAFARDAVAGRVRLAVSLDCLGSNGLALNGVGPHVDRALVATLLAAARRTGVPLSVPLPHILFSRGAPELERSDHRSFTERGDSALHLLSRGTEGFDTRYHTPGDSFAHMETRPAGDTVRFLSAFVDAADDAVDGAVGDSTFLPLSLDPTGLRSGTPIAILPGPWARGLALAAGALGLVLLPALARRGRSSVRGALRSLALLMGGGALAGAAFAAPFALGSFVSGVPAAWHAPFGAYVLAGAAWTTTIAVLLLTFGPRTGELATAAAGAIVLDFVLGVSFVALGVPELALIPWASGLLLGLACFVSSPWRVLLGLGGLPILAFLARPDLYREGVLTGSFPAETGVVWIVVAAALGCALAPSAVAVLRATGLAGVIARRRWLALVLAVVTAGFTARALRCEPYSEAAPANLHVTHWITEGSHDQVALYGGIGRLASSVTLTLGGEKVALATTRAGADPMAFLPRAKTPALVRIGFEDGKDDSVLVRIFVRAETAERPIDRLEVSLRSAGRLGIVLDSGGEALLAGNEPFYLQVFGVPPEGVTLTRRVHRLGPGRLDVSVHALLARPLIEVDAPGPFTVRQFTKVERRATLP